MKLKFNGEQTTMLNRIGFAFDVTGDLSDDQVIELEDRVGDYYNTHGFDADGEYTEVEPILGGLLDIITAD